VGHRRVARPHVDRRGGNLFMELWNPITDGIGVQHHAIST